MAGGTCRSGRPNGGCIRMAFIGVREENVARARDGVDLRKARAKIATGGLTDAD